MDSSEQVGLLIKLIREYKLKKSFEAIVSIPASESAKSKIFGTWRI